ncbi:MAG: GTPase [Deltaproteobacteria bacterium]
MRKKTVIMGAAGRDFHNFNTCFKADPAFEIVAFTATQIPFISDRRYPSLLSGPLYPDGIPIYPEEELARLIKNLNVDTVVFSYSDIDNNALMSKAALCTSLGADFVLLASDKTMLASGKTVIAVSAVRTGCGKSGLTRYIGLLLKGAGMSTVAIRHPMPYGDLVKERVQRFASHDDLRKAGCTIEEREEYEPLIDAGITVFAGVDYAMILKEAEKEADVIIWDGGNNDAPFIRPDLAITVADPLRAGDEITHLHGTVNILIADLIIVNKMNNADANAYETVFKNIRRLNPSARIIKTASVVEADGQIEGKKVLIIEDGPTLTHGGMSFGAGIIAAREKKAIPVDPRPWAIGSIRETFERFPHLAEVIPAMGYSQGQIKDLEATINAVPCDAVIVATPIDLSRIITINKPVVRVRYNIAEMDSPGVKDAILSFIASIKR